MSCLELEEQFLPLSLSLVCLRFKLRLQLRNRLKLCNQCKNKKNGQEG